MAQLKGRHTHIRYFDGDTRDRRHKAVPEETVRRTAIYECLRELDGVELIYAIRCPGGTIKIGYTRELLNRRRHFDSAFKAILAIKPGTYADEQALHAQLRESVAHGREYYHPTPEVLAFINDIRADLGVDPIAS